MGNWCVADYAMPAKIQSLQAPLFGSTNTIGLRLWRQDLAIHDQVHVTVAFEPQTSPARERLIWTVDQLGRTLDDHLMRVLRALGGHHRYHRIPRSGLCVGPDPWLRDMDPFFHTSALYRWLIVLWVVDVTPDECFDRRHIAQRNCVYGNALTRIHAFADYMCPDL